MYGTFNLWIALHYVNIPPLTDIFPSERHLGCSQLFIIKNAIMHISVYFSFEHLQSSFSRTDTRSEISGYWACVSSTLPHRVNFLLRVAVSTYTAPKSCERGASPPAMPYSFLNHQFLPVMKAAGNIPIPGPLFMSPSLLLNTLNLLQQKYRNTLSPRAFSQLYWGWATL